MSLLMPQRAEAARTAWGGSAAAVVCLALSLLAFAGSFALAVEAPGRLFAPETLRPWTEAGGAWFGAEPLRVLGAMGGEAAPAPEGLHPLFGLLARPATRALQALLPVDVRTAAALFSGATGAASVALLFLTLQRLGRRLLETALLCLLMTAASAWMFFYTVPETSQLGALGLLLALFVAAGPAAASPRREALRLAGVGAATLAAAASQGLFGLLLAVARLRPAQALGAVLGACALVAALAWVQARLLPAAPAPAAAGPPVPSRLLPPQAGGLLHISKVFWLDSLVAPQPRALGGNPHWQRLSLQRARPGSGSPLGLPALLLWGVLLGAGIAALRHSRAPRALKVMVVGGLAAQWGLSLVWGEETFLGTLLVLPALLLLASFGFERARLRRPLTVALLLLVPAAAFHNSQVLAASERHIAAQGSPRTALLEEMARRPLGPWPRGQGHLLLGVPGASLASKAYLEPAGAFSPWVGSFGLSFWITDGEGRLLQAAEQLPLAQTRQRLRLQDGRWPGADFATPRYAGRWQQQPGGAWELALERAEPGPGQRLELVLRAVGPAAGPLYRLQRQGDTLLVNGRWALDLPVGSELGLGDEQQGFAPGPAGDEVESAGGWAFARVVLPLHAPVRVAVRPLQAPAPSAGPPVGVPLLDLPDADFAASLRAQVQHLAMSVEERETRPGDPLNFGQADARDSARIVAALARAGNLALARRLAADLAERDFFGARDSEADAPALALWALEEVAARLSDPAFDRELWPHVRRKADWLLDCLGGAAALAAAPQGPLLPRLAGTRATQLVCLPEPGDLLAGRVGTQVPRLYLSAVAQRGLRDAAALARRLGEERAAERWSAAAGRLQAAWAAQMKLTGSGAPGWGALPRWMAAGLRAQGWQGARHAARLWLESRAAGGELRDPRTYASGLWPTQAAAAARAEFAARLQARGLPEPGADEAPPQRADLELAIAHQWLLLGEPQAAWETLRRHWRHPVAPGAYSWGFGAGEVDTSHGWEAVHGWVAPRHVTPHYGAAAEMLALQLDMLTRLDDSGATPVLLIGAGVPASWLARPLAAGGIAVRGAWVDWRWQDGRMEVRVAGRRYPVRLAEAFPADALLTVRYVGGAADPLSGEVTR